MQPPPPRKSSSLSGIVQCSRWAFGYGWQHTRGHLFGTLTLSLIKSGIPAAQALISREMINSLIALTNDAVPLNSAFFWVGALLVVTLVQQVVTIAQTEIQRRLQQRLELRLTLDMLHHAERLPIAVFEDAAVQDTMERARQHMAGRIAQFLNNLIALGNRTIQVISLAVILLAIQPLSILLVLAISLPFVMIDWGTSRRRYDAEYQRSTKRRWTNYFTGMLTNRGSVTEVRLLNLAPLLIDRYHRLAQGFVEEDRKLRRRQVSSDTLSAFMFTGAFLVIIESMLRQLIGGLLTVGDLVVYVRALQQLSALLSELFSSISTMLEQTLYVSDLLDFFALSQEPETPASDAPDVTLNGEVRFEAVSFTYPGAASPTLRDLSLHIQPGELIAIVGANGAGKTTLVKLLAGFYLPTAGRILLDGIDAAAIPRKSLHRQIAFVQQGFNRYEASAADNIAYGDWERLLGQREAVMEIVRRAEIAPLIEKMPEGADTLLGRSFGTFDLSGGQWQQIAVARAFARNAQMYIFDEPTASLDATMESKIVQRVKHIAEGHTTIIISHRFSTVEVADRILVLDAGQCVETGTHSSLMAHGGVYARLYEAARGAQVRQPSQEH
ncbi:MAG: ABC transporter ATP-binding protein [bacterium]|nr:ABC transporter ATP-binding protein [bacterium]